MQTTKVPQEWGMYTRWGNELLEENAHKLVFELDTVNTYIERLAAVHNYFVRFNKVRRMPNTSESGDTAVRNSVFRFARLLVEPLDIWGPQLEELWANSNLKFVDINYV